MDETGQGKITQEATQQEKLLASEIDGEEHAGDEVRKNSREKEALLQRLLGEALCRGQLALIPTLFAPAFVDHSTPDQQPGYAGVQTYFQAVRAGFPDIQVQIEQVIAQGEWVAVRTSWRGTHLGQYECVAPTGKTTFRTLLQIFRIVGGLITEEWNEGRGLLEGLEEKGEGDLRE